MTSTFSLESMRDTTFHGPGDMIISFIQHIAFLSGSNSTENLPTRDLLKITKKIADFVFDTFNKKVTYGQVIYDQLILEKWKFALLRKKSGYQIFTLVHNQVHEMSFRFTGFEHYEKPTSGYLEKRPHNVIRILDAIPKIDALMSKPTPKL